MAKNGGWVVFFSDKGKCKTYSNKRAAMLAYDKGLVSRGIHPVGRHKEMPEYLPSSPRLVCFTAYTKRQKAMMRRAGLKWTEWKYVNGCLCSSEGA